MSMTSRFSTAICTHGRNDLRGEVKPEVAEVGPGFRVDRRPVVIGPKWPLPALHHGLASSHHGFASSSQGRLPGHQRCRRYGPVAPKGGRIGPDRIPNGEA
jgi:hypothetical protein